MLKKNYFNSFKIDVWLPLLHSKVFQWIEGILSTILTKYFSLAYKHISGFDPNKRPIVHYNFVMLYSTCIGNRNLKINQIGCIYRFIPFLSQLLFESYWVVFPKFDQTHSWNSYNALEVLANICHKLGQTIYHVDQLPVWIKANKEYLMGQLWTPTKWKLGLSWTPILIILAPSECIDIHIFNKWTYLDT